ncbi:hypothetical protein C8Q74DRAFT_1196372 [Fomes fomentarius]|nr:hypothetical protein C8Q74DRAFT_1196372 [Fomes fomentarius]
MSSANYIPLTQISPSEFFWHPKAAQHASVRSYFTRKRTIIALVAATSLITLLVFLRHSKDDDEFDPFWPINWAYQPSYIAIPVPDTLPPAARPKLRPVRDLPSACLEQYYASGLPCHDGRGPVPMDILWTWVNGSDPLFVDARQRAAESYAENDPNRPKKSNNPSRMFRDHDELRHSIRSVLANFRPYTTRFHIVTSDFDYPEEQLNQSFPVSRPGYWRLGLQPQWLDSSENANEWRDGDVRLSLTHHAHFFEPYNRSNFNSYAIETQFSHLQDISENFIYMNDDFFMSLPLTPYSFYTHQYGLVFRIQKDMGVGPDWPHEDAKGEWRTMGVSNWLLSKRFGRRERFYVQHQGKALSFALIQEHALIWPEWLAKTATHAFRETEGGEGDVYQMFMFAHFVVERAREALLWTWVIGRVGGLDDSWSEHEEQRAWIELGGWWDGDQSKEIEVYSGRRETLNSDRVRENLKEGGIEPNGTWRTDWHFTNLDGYAYNFYGRTGNGNWPKEEWERNRRKCVIKRDECFGSVRAADGGPPKASDIFKEIAFNKPQCGDCVIVALVNKSGPLGLSSFLPHHDRRSPSSDEHPASDAEAIPHLPLVDEWQHGQFALRDVMKYAPDTSVREWSMRLMQRYRYVIGGTHQAFEQLHNLQQVRGVLAGIDRSPGIALMCLNDDLTRDFDSVSQYLYRWFEKKWGEPAAWEMDLYHRDDSDRPRRMLERDTLAIGS